MNALSFERCILGLSGKQVLYPLSYAGMRTGERIRTPDLLLRTGLGLGVGFGLRSSTSYHAAYPDATPFTVPPAAARQPGVHSIPRFSSTARSLLHGQQDRTVRIAHVRVMPLGPALNTA
jgi:hypothetical protein